jgi:hypothetical protein
MPQNPILPLVLSINAASRESLAPLLPDTRGTITPMTLCGAATRQMFDQQNAICGRCCLSPVPAKAASAITDLNELELHDLRPGTGSSVE